MPKVRRDGPDVAVELAAFASGPDSATASRCGTASRKASAASSFFSKVQPDSVPRASEQPASQRRGFTYIVGVLLIASYERLLQGLGQCSLSVICRAYCKR